MNAESRHSATRRTVLIAGAANVVVGVTKLTAGILSGSSAMLAEAAHSAADTLNQGFLLASVYRGDRPADREHQFGYGQERYFWSLLAAFGILIAGGGFSIFEGILALTRTGAKTRRSRTRRWPSRLPPRAHHSSAPTARSAVKRGVRNARF